MTILLSEKQTVSDPRHDEASGQTGNGQQQGLKAEWTEVVNQTLIGSDVQSEKEQQEQNGDADGFLGLMEQDHVTEAIA